MAQFDHFNWMVEKKGKNWQNILKSSYDAMCHILRLPHVNILVFIIVASVVARTHPWIHV